ncbi:outer membrane protein assembly factor BamB family protein [Paenibacillus sp. IHBB 3054]|uniref:outer membrane protein assembly factor BamB family protein n=1 Tax=Paenibacillus sp. IHBB 3054 TaxID=3425689 RepID=UPI003F664041
MKKAMKLVCALILIFVSLQYPPASAEAVNPSSQKEQKLEKQGEIQFGISSVEYNYLGTVNGLMYFKVPLYGHNPRNEKGQMLQEYIVAVNPQTFTIQWKLSIYGGYKLGAGVFFDQAGNLYGVVAAGLKQFSNETYLYSISPKGKLNWQVLFPENVQIYGLANNRLIVYDDSRVTAVNLNGTVAWKKDLSKIKGLASNSIRTVVLNEYLTLNYNNEGRALSFDVIDWNLKKKMSYPLNKNWTVEQVEKLNQETYIAKVAESKTKSLLVAVDKTGKQKWTKSIDPTTDAIYIVDGKLLFANNTGFYAMNAAGEQLYHSALNPLVSNAAYRLRIDSKYINISPKHTMNTETALTVMDRKSYALVYSFANPLVIEESQPGVTYDDLFFANNRFYMIYAYQLIQLGLQQE